MASNDLYALEEGRSRFDSVGKLSKGFQAKNCL